MTFLENLKNSREFLPGISGTIDSRTGIPCGLGWIALCTRGGYSRAVEMRFKNLGFRFSKKPKNLKSPI